jgi:hypothetical protein
VVGEHIDKAAERAWKHRFAQVLYEHFCLGGLTQAAALADAYAHADAQYLVRGLGSPEDEARSALTWIQAETEPAAADRGGDEPHPANPHNGAAHVRASQSDLLGVDLSE